MSGSSDVKGNHITIRRLSSQSTRRLRVDRERPRRRIEFGSISAARKIRIRPPARPSRRIKAEQLLQPVAIRRPVDGQALEACEVEVAGSAHPETRLALVNGRFRTELRSSAEGTFRFTGVPLNLGSNTLLVVDIDHEEWEQARASIRVVRDGRPTPFLGHKDPLTGAPLSECAAVVRCSECWTFCYLSSWNGNGNCPICCMRGLTPRYWTSNDDEFYMTRQDLVKR